MLIDKAQNITIRMMQSKKSGVEAESEETELKSSNGQFDDNRQGKLKTCEVKTRSQIFFFLQESCSTTGWLGQSQLPHIPTRLVSFYVWTIQKFHILAGY